MSKTKQQFLSTATERTISWIFGFIAGYLCSHFGLAGIGYFSLFVLVCVITVFIFVVKGIYDAKS